MEEALFLKDASVEREKHLQKQIQSMSMEINVLPRKYAEKNESALQKLNLYNNSLRQQFNADRRKYAEETCKLEELCAKLQTQSERAIREKRAAESELEKITRHIPAETDRLTMAIEEMHSRLRASERERHEASHKVERFICISS